MSFILDALRKSEAERQREATPTVARAPVAPVRRQVPAWSWALIGLLSLAIVALGVAWWRGTPRAPPAEENFAANSPVAVDRSSTDPANGSRVTANAPPRTAPLQTAPAAADPLPVPEPIARAPAPPRPIGDLAAVDPSLPPFRLDLLAYHADPARAYALINGAQYLPGERMPNGPTVAEIRRDGVVLSHRGETFLLRPR